MPPQEKVPNFNDSHPELEIDEVWMMNVIDPVFTEYDGSHEYERLNYSTKRMGNTAYNSNGNAIEGMRPVFVKKSEAENKIIAINPN